MSQHVESGDTEPKCKFLSLSTDDEFAERQVMASNAVDLLECCLLKGALTLWSAFLLCWGGFFFSFSFVDFFLVGNQAGKCALFHIILFFDFLFAIFFFSTFWSKAAFLPMGSKLYFQRDAICDRCRFAKACDCTATRQKKSRDCLLACNLRHEFTRAQPMPLVSTQNQCHVGLPMYKSCQ